MACRKIKLSSIFKQCLRNRVLSIENQTSFKHIRLYFKIQGL